MSSKLIRELESDKKHLTKKCERYLDKWILAAEALMNVRARLRKLKDPTKGQI